MTPPVWPSAALGGIVHPWGVWSGCLSYGFLSINLNQSAHLTPHTTSLSPLSLPHSDAQFIGAEINRADWLMCGEPNI